MGQVQVQEVLLSPPTQVPPRKADVRQSPTNLAVVQKLISHAPLSAGEKGEEGGRGGRGKTVCRRLSTLHQLHLPVVANMVGHPMQWMIQSNQVDGWCILGSVLG
jgi:hypothetical protein